MSKKHIVKGLIIGATVVIVIVVGLFLLLVNSQKLTLDFQVNETLKPLEGHLYLDNVSLGVLDNGKVTLVWEDFYPGELRLDILRGDKINPFYFDLTKDMVDYGEAGFYIMENDLKDLSLSVEDYNLDEQNDIILQEINKQRVSKGMLELKEDPRLNEIAESLAIEVIRDNLDANDIDNTLVADKMIDKKIFFLGTENYWYDYIIDSDMSLSQEFMKNIIKENYWSEKFFESYITHIGIVTECNEAKRCFTLLIVSQNSFSIEDDLKKEYLQEIDPYYILHSNGVDLTYESNVNVYFNSSKNAKVYLVESEKDYDKLIDRNSVDEIFLERSSNEFNRTIKINPGNIFVISAYYGDIEYSLDISEA